MLYLLTVWQAREFRDKEKLFEAASIAEWILPAVYMGHIGCVVWVKPPWSHQMRDGEYSLVVGREKTNSGRVRFSLCACCVCV